MHPFCTDPQRLHRQHWQQIWPVPPLAIIAIGQMLLTFAIISFETWSMIVSVRNSFLAIGYEMAFFFTITWISTFTVVCCNRGSQGCATHALVENILSIIASSILLYYDAQFLRYPDTCFWPADMCYNILWDYNWNYYDFDSKKLKLVAIKVQLACAAIMLFLSVVFVLIYVYTSTKVRARLTAVNPHVAIELNHQQLSAPPTIPVRPPQTLAWPPPSNS